MSLLYVHCNSVCYVCGTFRTFSPKLQQSRHGAWYVAGTVWARNLNESVITNLTHSLDHELKGGGTGECHHVNKFNQLFLSH